MRCRIYRIGLAAGAALAVSFFAQAAQPVLQVAGEPAASIKEAPDLRWRLRSFPSANTARMDLQPVSVQQLQALEAHNRQPGIKATQVGVGREATHQRQPVLHWVALAEGGAVTRIEVRSPGAQGLRIGLQLNAVDARIELRFAGSDAPERVVAWESAASAERLADAARVYWTPVTDGERQIIELYAPAGVDIAAVRLRIPQVSHLVTNSRANFALPKAIGDSGSCNVDTVCRVGTLGQDFVDAKNAVARMIFTTGSSSYTCTGTLLNDNVDGSQIPYFYSAHHCIDSQVVANTLSTFWGFEASSCGGSTAAANVQVAGGAQYLYSSGTTDALLLRLNGTPPGSAYFAGWDAAEVLSSADVLAIHHPQGDLKKSSLGKQVSQDADQIAVGWTSGTTEGGSSGSGLFTSSSSGYLLRGGLYGGSAACSNSGDLANTGNRDYYSRFDVVYPAISQYLAAATGLVATDHYLWMVPAAANTEQQGFLRLINRENSSGEVTVWGLDESGRRSSGTITLTLSPLEARQFNSQDLEQGNVSKGLTGSLGEGEGSWTVMVRSDLDLEALAYIRTPDGFLTSMHDRVEGDGVDWSVPMFNPAENPNQVSRLRLINSTTGSVSVQISGTDDSGAAGSGTVTLSIGGLSSIELTATDLESGNVAKGLSGSLGNGAGKWQLLVSATGRLTVQSLLYDPLGKLTNLSTLADATEVAADQRALWFVPPASNTAQQGFIRVINRESRASTVSLRGVDDAGQLSPGIASFTLAANASAQFNSQDMESGNVGKGLSGSLGDGSGDWRLLVTTDLDIGLMGLLRTPDGFLTTVHDVVGGDGLSSRVLIFNPAENANQVSVLRLINQNSTAASVTLQGIDDAGVSGPGGGVTLSLAAGAAITLTASDLENGNTGKGLSGSLGNGSGKWQLSIGATVPIKMQSLLRDPNGYLTNLSNGADGSGGELEP